ANGRLVCVDGNTGTEKWAVETLENNQNLQWAMSGSPLVVDDLVIVNPGAQNAENRGKAVRAYHHETGKLVWESGSSTAGYSSPQAGVIDGVRQLLLLDGTGVAGYDIATGRQWWRFGWPVNRDINVSQPLVAGKTRVSVSSGYGVGGVMLEVTKSEYEWNVK